jgi:hypothetical protein
MDGLLALCMRSTEGGGLGSEVMEVTQVGLGDGAPSWEHRGKLRATPIDKSLPTWGESVEEEGVGLSAQGRVFDWSRMQESQHDLGEDGVVSAESKKVDGVHILNKQPVPSDFASPSYTEELETKRVRRRFQAGTRGVEHLFRGGKRP